MMGKVIAFFAVSAFITCLVGEYGLGYGSTSWQFFAFFGAVMAPTLIVFWLWLYRASRKEAKHEKVE